MNKKIIGTILTVLLLAIVFTGSYFLFARPRHTQPTQTQEPTKPYLVTALGVAEVPAGGPYVALPPPYNALYITGSVNNTGEVTAYNAGLHVVAYAADGTLEVNMTVPLDNGASGQNSAWFGADAAINTFLADYSINNSLQLRSLAGGATTAIDITIFHESTVTNWTVTPVWTNLP
ncbi:MAG: hypothetical protein ABSD92_10135 [Candidatus Bathyarchaeia archaeon]|jgi:hypothetical protein